MTSADTQLTRSIKRRRRAAFVLSLCAACTPVVGILFALSLPLVLNEIFRDFESVVLVLFLASIVALFVLLLIRVSVWRCPKCGHAINGGLNQRFCGNCGVDFYDEYEETQLYEEPKPCDMLPDDHQV